MKKSKIPPEKCPTNVFSKFGNQNSASIPSAFCSELSDKLMQPNTTHTYEIQAMNVNGTIIWSQELTVTSLRELTEEEIYQNDMANIAFKTMIDNLLAALGQ